jgi:2'-5' RNA ligase superfamily
MVSRSRHVKAFDALWERFAPQVARGDGAVDTNSDIPIYTLVARLGSHRAQELQAAVASLGEALDGQYLYPASDLHLTLLYLSPYVYTPDPDMTSARLALANDAIAPLLEGADPPQFTIAGLGVFPTTIFAQLVPDEGTDWAATRHAVASALHDAGLAGPSADAFEAATRWDLCFVNVARFTRPPTADVVSALALRRDLRLGSVQFNEVELVRTDKFLSVDGTAVIDRYNFGQGRAPSVGHS